MSDRLAFLKLASVGAVALVAETAMAVPYASGVRNTSGSTYEFVLNESAQNVTVMRDGGNALDLGSLAAGRHTFDLGGFGSYDIAVTNNVPKSWTEISDLSDPVGNPDQLHQFFFRPNGVAVNTDPASPYFGTIYVSHPLENTSGALDRNMGDGVYSLTADLIGVDLANNFAVTDPNDATQAKAPAGWTVDQNGGTSPWQIALDDSNNVIVSDYSNQSGGIKYASPDLTTGGLVLAYEDGTAPLANFVTVEVEPGVFEDRELHGAIMSKPMVTGSVGVDLTVWGIDETMDIDYDTFNPDGGGPESRTSAYHLWRWDVGSQTDYEQPPELQVSATALSDVMDDPEVGFTDTFFDLTIAGIYHDGHYEEQFDQFYLTQNRNHGNESGIIIVGNDPGTGEDPPVLWSSKRWSFDNGLDGNNSLYVPESGPGFGVGIQDVFREIGSITISADGTKMFVQRGNIFDEGDFNEDPSVPADGENPVMGLGSNIEGRILVIPLDENGIPDIEIDDNGTPEDTSDDFITNIESFNTDAQFSRSVRLPISLDAAGNVYVTNNQTEKLQVYSPGGNTVATTSSTGTFSVSEIVALDGDYNGDGMVDAADYTIWRDTLGSTSDLRADGNGNGIIDAGAGSDYEVWVSNYGSAAPSFGTGSTVPEPTGLLLVGGLATLGSSVRRKRS